MTIWHNLAALLVGVVVMWIGRLIWLRARKLADLTIDFEVQWPNMHPQWGSQRNRRREAGWIRGIAAVAMLSGGYFALAGGTQLVARLMN